MQSTWILSGLVGLALCLGLSVLVSWLAFRAWAASTPDIDEVDELQKGNLAVAVVLSAMLISTGLVVREAVMPAASTLRTLVSADNAFGGWLQWAGYTAMYVVGSCAVALFGLVLGMRLFAALTPDLDEAAEVARGNVAVALVVAAVLVVVGWFLALGVAGVLEAAMPWGALPQVLDGGR